ncbi:DUF3035 domain-containing protein [Pelagibacterales bacterium SAG-MED47]|nr:DUF3035 domain-containing protein [Pelagibacterales bacterium SAG-MED47]
MKQKIKIFTFIVVVLGFLNGCQSLKKGLEGNKKSKSAEEFLIEKKNPLVLPPDFSKLPIPKNSMKEVNEIEDLNIEKILQKNPKKNVKNNSKEKNSLETSVLEKIKSN